MVDRMDQPVNPQRSSVGALIAALAGTVPVGLYLFVIMALGIGDQADIDNRTVSSGEIAAIFIIPVVGALALAVFLIRRWRRGWRGVWKTPLILLLGGLFWPALFVLLSRPARRRMLPTPPWYSVGGYCASCGEPLTADSRFCASCGAPRISPT
jgi:hypothetical protein